MEFFKIRKDIPLAFVRRVYGWHGDGGQLLTTRRFREASQ
jgi:hypothetical protein